MKTKPGRGRKPLLTDKDIEKISKKISENSAITIHELRDWIKKTLEITVCKSTTHTVMKRCGYSYKTARKRHYKADSEKQEEFKKN